MTVATSRLSYATFPASARILVAEPTGSGDHRWPLVAAALTALRETGRCSVRIVDADCRAGGLLLRAVRHARALGFTAIEGRGIDGAPSLVARAQSAARSLHDPAIGISFEVADLLSALADETDLPADILLWRGRRAGIDQAAVERAVEAAGRVVVVDMPHRAARAPHHMTRRDLAWRSAGTALFGSALAIGITAEWFDGAAGSLVTLLAFIVAIAGVVLLSQGKRVPVAWQAELRLHRHFENSVGSSRRVRAAASQRTTRYRL